MSSSSDREVFDPSFQTGSPTPVYPTHGSFSHFESRLFTITILLDSTSSGTIRRDKRIVAYIE